MTRRPHSTMLALATAAALSAGAVARADSRVLYDRNLQARTVELIGLDGLSLRFQDEFGVTRSLPLSSIAAVLPARSAAAGASAATGGGWVELADGQRFPGRLAPTSPNDEAVAWLHDDFGPMQIALERVAFVSLEGAGRNAIEAVRSGARTDDVLMLTNGDRLTGFLVAVDGEIEFESEQAGFVTLGVDRVAWFSLAVNPEPLEGLVVWLSDGAIARVADMRSPADGRVELRLDSAASSEFDLDDIEAIVFDAARLQPLASVLPDDQQPLGRRRLIEPLRLAGDGATPDAGPGVAPDLELPGPMRIDWTLPRGATRFSALAEMPHASFPWGDCEVVFEVDGVERARVRLNQETPDAEIAIDVEGEVLTMRVEPGAYGPVKDRVILRRPLLLLGN
jgi:hypothetical protein